MRTPKNYDGIRSSQKMLGEILPRWMGEFARRQKEPCCDILSSWAEIVGEQIASRTRAVSFVDGTLLVFVKSSALFAMLSQHEKPKILAKLQERFSKNSVRELRFRIG